MQVQFTGPLLLLSFALTGCSLAPTASPALEAGLAIQGNVHGGQQPVSGAHVYLFAANTTGYGNLSSSLLNATSTGHSDSVGAYVLTGADGSFSISGDYTCTANTQVYLYALGGNPGAGTNLASSFLAILGNCPGTAFPTSTYVWINEVSTVAAAYAMAGFAVDATHVSSSATALAQTGIANAFANAANLATLSKGVALTGNPAGNATVPQNEIDTLANLLAACVNTTGAIAGPTNPTTCYTLFNNAQSAGSSGTIPTETATAAINIAHNPGSNIVNLCSLQTAVATPFLPDLPCNNITPNTYPNDFTIALTFSGGGLNDPVAVAIDGTGNAWVVNGVFANTVTEFSSAGAFLTGTSGLTGGGIGGYPFDIAIDPSNNAWVPSQVGGTVTKISPSRTFLSGTGGYSGNLGNAHGVALDGVGDAWVADDHTAPDIISEVTNTGGAASGANGFGGGGLNGAAFVAIDGSGGVWVTNYNGNSVSKFSSAGVPASASPYTSGGFSSPQHIAVDGSGNAWIANNGGNTVIELSSAGSLLSGTGFTGGGIAGAGPAGIAIDGSGNVWTANLGASSISRLSNTGEAISPANGYAFGGALNDPNDIAIDGSGNVWVPSSGTNTVTELIGAATPVVTPLSAGVAGNTLGTRP